MMKAAGAALLGFGVTLFSFIGGSKAICIIAVLSTIGAELYAVWLFVASLLSGVSVIVIAIEYAQCVPATHVCVLVLHLLLRTYTLRPCRL